MFGNIFGRQESEQSNAQTVDLTDNLVANVWSKPQKDGSVHVNCGVRRKDWRNPTKTYATLWVEHLFEQPLAIARLAQTLAQYPVLPGLVRQGLEILAEVQLEAAKQLQARIAHLVPTQQQQPPALRPVAQAPQVQQAPPLQGNLAQSVVKTNGAHQEANGAIPNGPFGQTPQ